MPDYHPEKAEEILRVLASLVERGKHTDKVASRALAVPITAVLSVSCGMFWIGSKMNQVSTDHDTLVSVVQVQEQMATSIKLIQQELDWLSRRRVDSSAK
jgi:hypothetical protein